MGRTWGSPCEYDPESSVLSGVSLSAGFFVFIASWPFLFITQLDLFLTIKGSQPFLPAYKAPFCFCFAFLLLLFAVLG